MKLGKAIPDVKFSHAGKDDIMPVKCSIVWADIVKIISIDDALILSFPKTKNKVVILHKFQITIPLN